MKVRRRTEKGGRLEKSIAGGCAREKGKRGRGREKVESGGCVQKKVEDEQQMDGRKRWTGHKPCYLRSLAERTGWPSLGLIRQ